MATRRPPFEGLTPETAALTGAQRAALELRALVDEEEPDDEPQTPADRIAVMLDQFADAERCKVSLYRVTGPNEYEWLSDYSPEQFESTGFEGIRAQFGAGKFQVRLYATMPDSKRFVVRMKENIQIGASANAVALPAAQQNNDLGGILKVIAEGQQKLFEALQSKPAVDPMDQMKSMFGMMTMMREAMGLNNQQAPQKSSIGEIVDAVKELRSVADEINPKPDSSIDPENPMAMLPKLLELITSAMNNRQPIPVQQLQPVAIQNQPAANQPQTQQTEGEDVNFLTILELKKHLALLIEKANVKADIKETAQFVYDQLPDEIIDAYFDDAWWDMLKMLAPEVEPHKEWFEQVRAASLELFETDANNEALAEKTA